MRRKTILRMLAPALAALLFSSCAPAPAPLPELALPAAGSSLRLAVATDIHFLPRSVVREGEAFTKAYAVGDGKMIQYIPELVDTLIDELLADPPEVVLLTGDLTLNGERVGHMGLAEKLRPLREAGIRVLVIPGNHDIQNAFASGYNRDKTYNVRTVTAEEFAEIYEEYGYGQAISRDTASLSYICPLSEDLWVAMLDTNKYRRDGRPTIPENSGELLPETLRWLEGQLQAAQKEGVEVISATHHSLLDQSGLTEGYTLDNTSEVLALYEEYGVRVNFSGHIHIQNITVDQLGGEPFYDIATSSYAVYTNQYGRAEYLPGESLSYHTQEADVEGWARRTGSQNPDLLDFEDYSYQFFYDISYWRSYSNLYQALSMEEGADIEVMAKAMGVINPAYFSGYAAQLRDEVLASDYYALYRKFSGFVSGAYLNRVLKAPEQDPRRVTVDLK